MNPYSYKAHPPSTRMLIANQSNILTVKESIVKPAFMSFDAETERYRLKAEAGDAFARVSADLQEFRRRELTISLCLVIQSVWERQLRSYLEARGEETSNEQLKKDALKNEMKDAFKCYAKVSGVDITSAPGWDKLQLLHTLGNVCRHGSGGSLKDLYKLRPDLWQKDLAASSPPTPSMFGLCIPEAMLDDFLVTISCFWEWLTLSLELRTAQPPLS